MEGILRHWPIAGLVVRTPRVELRWPGDEDLVALAELAAAGIHDSDAMPFGVPWTRAPAGQLEQDVLRHVWLQRGQWSPERWNWTPAVVVDGEVVGVQAVDAEQFGLRRTVGTGLWLGRRFQGQGIGTEMRAAVLHLCFDGLGACRAETSAAEDNAASLGVTAKLGYRPNGDTLVAIEGKVRHELLFVLTRDDWEPRRRDDIEILGLDPCLSLFGVTPGR